ncbi:MAG: hypothetical protein ACJ8BF_13200 [Gemmatimonadales bacterium]
MAKWKNQAAQLGMGTLVAGLKAVERGVSRKQYKRLLATAVAQLLTLHPDFGPRKARRRARRVTGARPAKKLLVKPGQAGLKEGLETAAVAAVSGAALKAAGKLGRKVVGKLKDQQEADQEQEQSENKARQA